MAIIAGLSDNEYSHNSVEITQISCFPLVAKQGFGPGSLGSPGPLLYHRNSFSVYNPIHVIAIAMRYNICDVILCLFIAESYWKFEMTFIFVQ